MPDRYLVFSVVIVLLFIVVESVWIIRIRSRNLQKTLWATIDVINMIGSNVANFLILLLAIIVGIVDLFLRFNELAPFLSVIPIFVYGISFSFFVWLMALPISSFAISLTGRKVEWFSQKGTTIIVLLLSLNCALIGVAQFIFSRIDQWRLPFPIWVAQWLLPTIFFALSFAIIFIGVLARTFFRRWAARISEQKGST